MSSDPARQASITAVTVEHSNTPLGVGGSPRFAWITSPLGPPQDAWRIVVRGERRGRGEVWDTGRRRGDESTEIPYAGPELRPLERYHVEVESWSADACARASSWFVSGVPAEDPLWRSAHWIGGHGAPDVTVAPLLRHEFAIDYPIAAARLVVAAGGYARVRINGVPPSAEMLTPGFTDYDVRVQYTVADVTSLVHEGDNAITIELGRGFYGMRGRNTWDWHAARWHAEPAVRALLVLDGRDGTRRVVGTGPGWRTIEGPTRSDDLYAGEDFDDRVARSLEGCELADFDDGEWDPVALVEGPRGVLEAQRQPAIEVCEEFEPETLEELRPGEWLATFPRVIAGWARVGLSGSDGEAVEILLSERLDGEGRPDVSDPKGYYDGRFQTHRLVLAGRRLDWEPRFSYQGFRYALVRCVARPRVTARAVRTAVARTGRFACSSPMLTRLHELAVRTVLNNLHGIPTDTPTYEKNGWTGDAMLGAEFMLLNLDVHELLAKWLQDVADTRRGEGAPSVIAPDGGWHVDWAPAPTWHSVLVLIPELLHRHRGDERLLRTLWPDICGYLQFELDRSTDGIATTTLGDWVAPGTDPGGGNPVEDPRVPATAFLYAMLRSAGRIARILGEQDEVWESAARGVRAAFLAEFFDDVLGVVRGDGDDGYRQSHNVLAVAFGLVDDHDVARVVSSIARDVRAREVHLNTGALSTKWILPVLTEHGHADLALALAEQTSYPSWGHWVQQGTTALWEHWHQESRSRNHYFLGTFDDWLFGDVAGIRPLAPGWRRIRIAPRLVDRLEWAEADVQTPMGKLSVAWERRGAEVVVRLVVPSGAVALVEVGGRSVECQGGVAQLAFTVE